MTIDIALKSMNKAQMNEIFKYVDFDNEEVKIGFYTMFLNVGVYAKV